MIIIDTNVLSEEMKPSPSTAVHDWFLRQNSADLYTTTVCEAEILSGVAILPEGRRKRDLGVVTDRIFDLFTDRILPFDRPAAKAYAEIIGRRRQIGRPINDFDAQIAAIARSRGMTIATRNVADFEEIGVQIIDPWDEA